ncbi:MAG TPA: magnesium transporter CorA family protein [Candidatus Methanofastidiosa archaeon]|nr:magnesium transporter CorA family protein [Candidatus Methanofastidiosa archaeon]
MIRIYKRNDEELEEIEGMEKGCWIRMIAPTEEEITDVSQQFDIPVDFIKDPLDRNERSRTEIEGSVTLIILRTPHFDPEEENVQFTTMTLGIIICETVIITVSLKFNDILEKITSKRVKNINPAKKSRFVLQLFYHSALTYLDYLNRINARSSAIEDELHESLKNEELIKLLNLEKSLVYISTSLKANELMMEKLQKSVFLHLYPEDEDLFDDVIIENRQAIEVARIHTDILTGTMDAFASVISNNLNVVMKVLTSVTIILMLPTLVASIYGMNINLPFSGSAYAFEIMMGVSLFSALMGIFFLYRKKWI